MTREEIARGLRCSASTGDKDCGKCPWGIRGEFEGGVWESCDCDRMAVEAADLLENDWSQILALQRELELKRAQLDCAAASAEKLRRRNAAEYCEDVEMALSLLREKRLVNGTSIYPLLGEGIDDLFSHNEQIRIWVLSPDTGHSTCVWKGMAWMMPTEVRRLPLLRVSARAPEETEVIGYLEIETELPAGWKLREEGAAPRRGLWEAAVKYRRDREAAEKERLVCPHCGGRAHHTVGGKEFCSLCLEEMRRE